MGFNVQLFLRGANDIEPEWSSASSARSWAGGYSSNSSVPYYDYGTAGGCPWSGTGSTTDGLCNNGWHQSDVAYVSWGNALAYPLPEIYLTDWVTAWQWQQISVYAYYHISWGRLRFVGSFTQYQACQQYGCDPIAANHAADGWIQLHSALNSDSKTAAGVSFATDIRWDP